MQFQVVNEKMRQVTCSIDVLCVFSVVVVHNRPSETTGSRPQLLTETFPGTGRSASSREMVATQLPDWTNGEGATVKAGPMASKRRPRRRPPCVVVAQQRL